MQAAACLGVPRNKVVVRTKRLGGGFGGKETRFCIISSPAVIAAKKYGLHIRLGSWVLISVNAHALAESVFEILV